MSEDRGGFFEGHGLQSMGILNALRTGDPRVDMLVALAFPFIIQQAFKWFQVLKNWITKDWRMNKAFDERTIVHTVTKSRNGGSYGTDQDTQNTILLKAIQMYLHSVIKLKLPQAEVDLTSTEDKNSNLGRNNRYYYDSDDDDDEDDRTIVGALAKYKVIRKPFPGQWFDLGVYGAEKQPDDSTSDPEKPCQVWFRIERGEEAGEDGKTKDITSCYRFQAEDGKAIDCFIDKAYQWYMQELKKMEDHARYLYELKAEDSYGQSNNEEGGRRGRVYTRYRLSDEKTFESLFFGQKEGLLKILDNFQQRSGKYAIKGYPHKLGLLLTGPPGTGKTSLIKALAHYTKRSIINVPLARVSTNSELMAIFNDVKKYVEGEYVPVKLGFKDVIFVMEDVDAASGIVKRRDGKKTADVIQVDQLDMPLPKPLWHMFLESTENSCQELVEMLQEKSDRLRKEASNPELLKSITKKITSVPGLSTIGEAGDDPSLRKISREARSTAQQIMSDQQSMRDFLGSQAVIIKNLLKQGAVVDDDFVDELLGRKPLMSAVPNRLTREISYTRNNDDDGLQVEENRKVVTQKSYPEHLRKLSNPHDSDQEKNEKNGPKKSLYDTAWAKLNLDELNLSG